MIHLTQTHHNSTQLEEGKEGKEGNPGARQAKIDGALRRAEEAAARGSAGAGEEEDVFGDAFFSGDEEVEEGEEKDAVPDRPATPDSEIKDAASSSAPSTSLKMERKAGLFTSAAAGTAAQARRGGLAGQGRV